MMNVEDGELFERMREAMQEFVDRVEKGEVLSRYTYKKFKGILDAVYEKESS